MKKEKWFIGCFILIIFGVLACYGYKQIMVMIGKEEITITDNWKFFEPKKENNIVDKVENKIESLKTYLENRANNYFPFYIKLNEIYQGFNFKTNSLLYEDVPIKTNSDGEYLFYNVKDKFYYLETDLNKEELDERLEKQINFFNNLASLNIETYIYLPTRYELTTFKKNNLSNYITLFEKKLNDKIKVTHMKITDIEDYKNKYYKTDHHWNMYGAIEGYKDIMKMMEVPTIDNLKIKQVGETNYYGSMAKTAMNSQISDKILDVDLKLDYDVLVNGKEKDELFKPRTIAKNKKNIYYDYYVQYFNGQYGNIIYDYKQPEKENLLIFSDSFAWQIDYLIAASFNKTYVINLRYDDYLYNSIDIKQYMKDNNITKVLFLYEAGATLFDHYDYDFIGKVR